eukprot:2030246-Pyramimonas_sp.AAC.1
MGWRGHAGRLKLPRRAPSVPRGPQRRARVVRGAEQGAPASWLTAGTDLTAEQNDDGRARRRAARRA